MTAVRFTFTFLSIMEVIQGWENAQRRFPGCAVAVGNFDGVHVGHQALLRKAISYARKKGSVSVAATFEPHPERVLFPQHVLRILTPLGRKLELFAALGIDYAVVQPFDLQYADIEQGTFVSRDLFGALSPSQVIVGSNFFYGKGRQGTTRTLSNAGYARGVGIEVLSPVVSAQGTVISSTEIRSLIARGQVEQAAKFLGRPFSIGGLVVPGKQIGRTIGFPTANLGKLDDWLAYPLEGVYLIRGFTKKGWWNGVGNIGRKPTVGGHQVVIEAHLFDFEGDLYGSRLELEFLRRLRAEKKFSSLEELRRAIAFDCSQAREVQNSVSPPNYLSPFSAKI